MHDDVVERMVGRERELQRLMTFALASTRRGGGLLLQGPPGIGKSFTLAAFCEQARTHGFQQLHISGVQSEARLAFAGLHQLLRPLLHRAVELPPRQREALLSAFGMSETAAPDPYLIALAGLELLTLTSTRNPVLAIVDDAQWLDQPTAEALAFVLRRLGDDHVAFVISTRSGYASPLSALELPVIELGPLDEDHSATLLDVRAPELDRRLRNRVLTQAGGNPLALVELAAAPHPPGTLQNSAVTEMPMTDRLERAFTSRYVDLSDPLRMLLLLAAASDTSDLSEVVSAGQILLQEVLINADIWNPAINAGLVTVEALRIHFRHPLVRSAIYHRATTAQRASVHGALAQSLADQPDRRVWHRAAATLQPDEGVAAEIEDAADRAEARGGRLVTLEALERSALLTPNPGRRAERFLRSAELALELGDPLAATRLIGQIESRRSWSTLQRPAPTTRRTARLQRLRLRQRGRQDPRTHRRGGRDVCAR